MSFFVSESLKGIITEKDLEAVSPIRVVEEKTKLQVQFYCDNIEDNMFEVELIEVEYSKNLNKLKITTDRQGLINIFNCDNQKISYAVLLETTQYMKTTGTFILKKLEFNKEDNYAVCKIDIFKRGN